MLKEGIQPIENKTLAERGGFEPPIPILSG
jgi:hypothetical protein